MSSPKPTAVTIDEPAIVRAERRLGKLERLSDIGMELAEEIRERNVKTAYHPEPKHDPSRGFALVSRAVRLTIVLETRIDAQILAMRKGEWAPAAPRSTALTAPFAPLAPDFEAVAAKSPSPARAKARDGVWGAINQQIRDVETAKDALDRLHESLIEREDYDDYLDRPWRECVAAICADLGVEPDWNLWSDEDGFKPPATGGRFEWHRIWKYDRGEADLRRKRREESSGIAPRPTPERRRE